MNRIAVLTSGGDSPGMNACLRAVVRGALYNGMEVFGVERGYDGLIDDDIFEMKRGSVSDIIQRGGTVLKTARSERFMSKEGIAQAARNLKTHSIGGLIVIGGNGSLQGALELADAGIGIIGLPGTIDNDLPFTDFTIGFDTAVNTVLSAIGNIRDTSHSHDRTTIIEVMGRECGDIAVYAGLAGGAEVIMIPEEETNIPEVLGIIEEGKRRGKTSSIIIKSEGVPISSETLAEEIHTNADVDARVVILGYVQRGGSPTARDRIIASKLGYEAVMLLKRGEINKAVGISEGTVKSYNLREALEMDKPSMRDLNVLGEILSK